MIEGTLCEADRDKVAALMLISLTFRLFLFRPISLSFSRTTRNQYTRPSPLAIFPTTLTTCTPPSLYQPSTRNSYTTRTTWFHPSPPLTASSSPHGATFPLFSTRLSLSCDPPSSNQLIYKIRAFYLLSQNSCPAFFLQACSACFLIGDIPFR